MRLLAAMALAASAAGAQTPVRPAATDFQLTGTARQGGVLTGVAPAGTAALLLDGVAIPRGTDDRFLIAFDRDAPDQARLSARLANGTAVERVIAVAPRDWRIERVDVAKRPGVTDAEFEKLRAPEVARIAAARAINADSPGWRQRFAWPARARISGVFGSQRIYRGNEPGAYHSGVDIAGGAGAPVTAPADGVVVLAADKPLTLEGNLLIVDHGMGLNSAFLHLSRIDVRVGDRVKRGQLVGAIGSTGRATGPHLHWAVKWRAARIDPASLAGPVPGQDAARSPVATDER